MCRHLPFRQCTCVSFVLVETLVFRTSIYAPIRYKQNEGSWKFLKVMGRLKEGGLIHVYCVWTSLLSRKFITCSVSCFLRAFLFSPVSGHHLVRPFSPHIIMCHKWLESLVKIFSMVSLLPLIVQLVIFSLGLRTKKQIISTVYVCNADNPELQHCHAVSSCASAGLK